MPLPERREGLTRDDVLDNITLTWLTNTALSGARLYWENKGASFFAVKGVVVPTAVSVFPDELYPAPRSWAERAYPKLIHYNKLDKGGHFAAWEQPKLFTEELRAGFRSSAQIGLKMTARASRAPSRSRSDNDLKKTHHEPDRKGRVYGQDQDHRRP